LALLHDVVAFVSTLNIGGGFSPAVAGVVALVLFLDGVVSGLSGFAFSAVAACVLWLLPPLQAVPLIMLLSACNQLLSVGTLRKEMVLRGTAEREGALAYIAGGLVGVPIGLGLLQALPTSTFTGELGLFLIVYSVLVLLKPDSLRIKLSGWKPAVAVGAAGGMHPIRPCSQLTRICAAAKSSKGLRPWLLPPAFPQGPARCPPPGCSPTWATTC
jgi:sulfite exporter TauE/SafE